MSLDQMASNIFGVVPGLPQRQTVKHGGGSVLIWCSMSTNSVGEMTFIDGTRDTDQVSGIPLFYIYYLLFFLQILILEAQVCKGQTVAFR